MPMNPNFLCCIGAELKNSTQQTTRMTQVYLYRAFENQTINDMLSDGFFNEALGVIRQDDLLLLYSPNETPSKWVYARVSDTSRDGVEIKKIEITAQEIIVDTAGMSNLSGDNLQEILNNLDALLTVMDNAFVRKDGTSVMTGPLKFSAGSMRGAIAGGLNGVAFFKMDAQGDLTQIGSLSDTQFVPSGDNTLSIGTTVRKISRIYLDKLNNGYDIGVPETNSTDTLALKSQVDDAANSGEQLYTTGVWYAKMYAATTVPTGSEYEGRNYADFSQVDGNNDPIIVVYTYTSGAWTQTAVINPPKTHNGYMTITSKIWDIVEQAGQQGGLVLWSHNQETFTPYPRIVSFDSANITNSTLTNCTAEMPATPTGNSIVNIDYLSTHSGTGRNVGDIFFTSRTDNELNGAVECNGGTYDGDDFTGSQSPVALMEAGKLPYVSLAQYATLLSTQGSVGVFGWDGAGTTTFRVPSLNDVFIETGTAAQIGDYLPAGLPNITAKVQFTGDTNAVAGGGAAYDTADSRTHDQGTGVGIYSPSSVLIDASKQNAIYGNSNTVQPNTVRYRAMVQLAIAATDEAVMTCTAVTAQVAANTSAINGADYVIESQLPTAQNNYTWYRKYKSGWVEQGGQATIAAQTSNTQLYTDVNLPLTMANQAYLVNVAFITDGGSTTGLRNNANGRGTTKLTIGTYSTTTISNSYIVTWEVKGIAA